MASVFELVFSIVLCVHGVTGEVAQMDQVPRGFVERCTRDIGTLLEDVKMLLARPAPSCGPRPEDSAGQHSLPRSCQDLQGDAATEASAATADGLATIFLPDAPTPPQTLSQTLSQTPPPSPLTVFCDQTTSGGGWIVLLRRVDNHENFPTRNWQDYKSGFGNPTTSSFWLGLEAMHQLTKYRHATLRVELEDFDGETRYAEYRYFRVASESQGYRLFVDGYEGDAGDALTYHSGQKFSTAERDQDVSSYNCATSFKGAWWYKLCVVCCLTGNYIDGGHHTASHQGIYWRYWKGPDYSYKRAEMKIRY